MRDWLMSVAGRENIWIFEVFIVVLATLAAALAAKPFSDESLLTALHKGFVALRQCRAHRRSLQSAR